MNTRTALWTVTTLVPLAAGCALDDEMLDANGIPLNLPEYAVEVAPNLFYLGEALDVDGTLVEGFAIFHPAERAKKPTGPGGGGGTTCYGFLASGAYWKTGPEGGVVNAANNDSIDSAAVLADMNTSVDTWEDGADDGVDNDSASAGTILGAISSTTASLAADTSYPDDFNEIYFSTEELGGSTLAMTTVWGIFGGRPTGRQLVAYDMVFNDDHTFGDVEGGDTDVYDFLSLAVHEMGHSFGMDDLYTTSCSAETMFGYGDLNDATPRTLESGDLAGIYDLYN